MPNPFDPCRACSRHVRADAHACPFCGDVRPPLYRRACTAEPARRVARAAIFFGAVASVTAAGPGVRRPGAL
jgi:hypothetical protein